MSHDKGTGPDITPDPFQDSPPPSRSSAVTVAQELRRRRDVAGRLPPLPDGRRDPLDDLTGLPVRRACRCLGAEFTAEGVRPCCQGAA
jgi:hypothetical protein